MVLRGPIKTFATTMAIVFVCEFIVMVIIPYLKISKSAEILIDPIILAILSAPLLFLFLLKPLRQSLERQIKSENEAITAREAALSATQAKSQFLAHMSHEVRTPLNGVVTMNGLMLESGLTLDQTEYSETIEVCSRQMQALVNDVLDISKIESGKLDLEDIDFDVRGVVNEVQEIIAAATGKTKVAFKYEVAPDVPVHLTGDPLRIKQVLINFTNNAAKFTKNGEIKISIELIQDSTSHSRLKCAIQDTGVGIPEHKMADLFLEFSQIGSSTARKYGGTGLGLAISKQLIELMGGEIGVESEVGKGSTFWFTVKLKKHTPETCRAVKNGEEATLTLTPEQIRSTRILLADDDPVNRRVSELLIHNKLGFPLTIVADGVQVISALKKDEFDLILMDCLMPKMNGLETTRMIRDPEAMIPNSDIPIIALTGRTLQSELQECFDAGMSDHVVKPIDVETLQNVIARQLLAQVPS